MIRGVRRADEAKGLGLGRRLMVRVGALLKKKLAVTAAVLESAGSGTPLEALLLDGDLLQRAEKLDEEGMRELLAKHLPEGGDDFTLNTTEDGFRVLCLAEELEADGWEVDEEPAPEPAPADATQAKPTPGANLPVPVAAESGDPLARSAGPGVGASSATGEPLFTNVEIGRLRLKAVTAANAAERIEALRILAHAPIDERDKAEAVFEALNDRDSEVRSEAAGLLVVLGVTRELGETLQALNHETVEVRVRGAERLAKRLTGGASDLELAAVAAAVQAALKMESEGEAVSAFIALLEKCGAALARSPARLADLIRVLLDQLFRAERGGVVRRESLGVYPAVLRLLKSLHEVEPDQVKEILRQERAKVTDSLAESFLLQVLLDFLAPGSEEQTALLAECAAFLAKDTRESRDTRAVGMAMVQRGEPALNALADVFLEATVSARKYFLRLFDDLVRYHKVSPEAKERAAFALLAALESGSRALRMVALGCRYVADPEISEEMREKLANACLASLSDLGFRSDVEIAEDHVARIGLPAVRPLVDRLEPGRPTTARSQAVKILGNLSLHLKPPPGQMRRTMESITDLLRKLQALATDKSFPDRGALFAAMGKLVSSPAASKEAGEVVARNLLDAAVHEEGAVERGIMDGLAWVASSRRADSQFIATVSGLLRRCLNEVQVEVEAVEKEIDGEQVIEISSGDDLVESLPIAVKGVSRIACSSSCPTPFRRELVLELVARWKQITTGSLVWGPANATLVVDGMRDVGSKKDLPHDLRMAILRALAPRIVQTTVMHAVTTILQASDTERTCLAALSVGQAILNRRGPEGRFDPEDRPDILRALARVAGRKHLGSPEPESQQKARHFRQAAMEELYQGAKDRVPGAYDGLIAIRDNGVLSADKQSDLERRLSEFHSIRLA